MRVPAQVLADFCVACSDFRGAAAAQLALARRLRDERPDAFADLHHALSARAFHRTSWNIIEGL